MPHREGIVFGVTGLDETMDRIGIISAKLKRKAGESLHESGEKIMGDSMENYVPVATGNLRATGYVEPPKIGKGEVVIEMGYGGPAAPYALVTHENPRAGKTKGVSPQGAQYPTTQAGKPTWATHGQWKYLETPAKRKATDTKEKLFNDIDNLFK